MPDEEMTPERFHGLKGKAQQYASLGVIGLLSLMCAELVLIQNPSTQATHLKTIVDLQEKAAKQLKEERELSKQEAEKSRQHGAEVGKELSVGLRQVADAATELKFTFQAEQEKTRENNNRLHAERMKAEQEKANK